MHCMYLGSIPFHKTFSCLYVCVWYAPIHDVNMYYFLAAGLKKKPSSLRLLGCSKHLTNHGNRCCHPRPCPVNTIQSGLTEFAGPAHSSTLGEFYTAGPGCVEMANVYT